MKERLLKEFQYIYDDEQIKSVMYVEHKQELYIECKSGYAYKVSYNGGCIETICLN